MHENDSLRYCPYCETEAEEDAEHLWWTCPAWRSQRADLFKLTDEETTKSWPACTRRCGIWTSTLEADKRGQVVLERMEEEYVAPFPPDVTQGDQSGEWYEDDYLIVASDGACPNQGVAKSFQRAGWSLYYGKNHPANISDCVRNLAQGAQRGELQSAAQWVSWAWNKQKLLTDSNYVYKGISKILAAFSSQEHRKHLVIGKQKHHRDLWRRIENGIKQEGANNFAVEKVKAHRKWKDVEECDEREKEVWRRNEEADKGAVEGAKKITLPKVLHDAKKKEMRIAKAVQMMMMMIRILEARKESAKKLGRETLDRRAHDIQARIRAKAAANDVDQEEEEDPWAGAGLDEPEPQHAPTEEVAPTRPAEQLDLINMRREEVYPQYPWQPPRSQARTTKLFQPIIPEKITTGTWTYAQSLFPAMVWYWNQVKWLEEPVLEVGEATTSWAELAIDFQIATHCALEKESEDADGATLERRARYFAAASERIEKLCKTKVTPGSRTSKARSVVKLGFAPAAGIIGRPVFINHEMTMQALFRTAVTADDAGAKGNTLKVIPSFTPDGPPKWKQPKLALSREEQVKQRRRMREENDATSRTCGASCKRPWRKKEENTTNLDSGESNRMDDREAKSDQ